MYSQILLSVAWNFGFLAEGCRCDISHLHICDISSQNSWLVNMNST